MIKEITSENVLFHESQRVRQWWIWGILIGIDALIITGIVRQVILGKPFGDHPMSNLDLIITAGLLLVLNISVVLLRLETFITTSAIYIRFSPFQSRLRRIPLDSVARIYLRTYRPVAEFGGWGYRYSLSGAGIAWNISGSQGIQLELKSGKKTLIGTSDPEGASAAIAKIA